MYSRDKIVMAMIRRQGRRTKRQNPRAVVILVFVHDVKTQEDLDLKGISIHTILNVPLCFRRKLTQITQNKYLAMQH